MALSTVKAVVKHYLQVLRLVKRLHIVIAVKLMAAQ